MAPPTPSVGVKWYNSGMDSAQQLAQFNPDPALAAYVDKLLAQVKQDAELIQQNTVLRQQNTAQILTLTKQIQHAELKNQALVLELAYYRRIRFANKSEQLSPDQRALFDECWAADITAIEAQIGQLDTPNTEDATTAIPKPARPRAGRQPLPDHLPRIIHRHEPASCQCGACGRDLIKHGLHARHFLAGWQGHLMVDDYAGYKALFTQGITELACFAHARRKFFDLHAANQSPIAAAALQRIAALYAIEQAADKLDAAGRLQLRQTQAKPLLDELHDWLIQTRIKVADGSGTARALDYSIKRWPALIRYADSGILPIDNNPVENAIRPIAIGKKNWLFAGSERAGKRAAAIQSLLATAKLNGLEPYAWLKDTLEKLPTWPNSQIDELLPFRNELP